MVHVLITLTPNPDASEDAEKYKKTAVAIRDEYGAEVVLRMQTKERLVGCFEEASIRILKFPSIENVQGWLTDARYLEVLPFRDQAYQKVTITILEDF